MPSVTGSLRIARPVEGGVRHPMKIQIGNQAPHVVPYAPIEVTLETHGREWHPSERAGQKPVLRTKNVRPRQTSFTLQIISPDYTDITDEVEWYSKTLAMSKDPITITYDKTFAGVKWRVMANTHRITHRNAKSEPIGAEVSLTFMEILGGSNSGPVAQSKLPQSNAPSPQAIQLDRNSESWGTNPHLVPDPDWVKKYQTNEYGGVTTHLSQMSDAEFEAYIGVPRGWGR